MFEERRCHIRQSRPSGTDSHYCHSTAARLASSDDAVDSRRNHHLYDSGADRVCLRLDYENLPLVALAILTSESMMGTSVSGIAVELMYEHLLEIRFSFPLDSSKNK